MNAGVRPLAWAWMLGVRTTVVWAWLVVVVGVAWWRPCLAHSTHEDPHLNPGILKASHPHQEVSEAGGGGGGGGGGDGDAGAGGPSLHVALEVVGGEEEARRLAHTYHLHYVCQVFTHPPVYHLHQPEEEPPSRRRRRARGLHQPEEEEDLPNRRRRRAADLQHLVHLLAQEPGVQWVEQQTSFVRDKRRVLRSHQYDLRHGRLPDQYDHRQGRPPDTTSSDARGTYTHHTIPADIRNSRSIIGELFRRHREAGGPRTTSWIPREDVDHWTGEEEEEDVGLKEHQTTGKKDATDLNRGLVRIPLYRTFGNSVDQLIHQSTQRQAVDTDEKNLRFSRDNIPSTNNRENSRNRNSGGESNHLTSTPGSAATGEEVFRNWTDHPVDTSLTFNDPFYKDQWYLHNTGQLGRVGYDLNVTWAWLRGYTGRGVVLSILDDGIQTTNADIADHYEAEVSYSVVRDGRPLDDPSPRLDPSFSNSHGTYCAAVVAAVPNNSVCGVGVAYEARIGGVRIVDGTVTDVQEATALSRHLDKVDVFSASWGPTDDGTKVEGPSKLARRAFLEGVTKGREGKGVVYVWASGNGGLMGDNCNLDGYTSSIYTLSVSALTDTGSSTFYEEPCASTMGAVYVGGEHFLQDAVLQHKRHLKNLALVVPELDGHCSASFQGTSAAAPLMAGVVALILHANPSLTWRDVQHLLVETAAPTTQALREEGWSTNGHGRMFHLLQGFGAIDAGKMVEAALKWKNVKPQKTFNLTVFHGYRPFHPYEWLNKTHDLDLSDVPLSATMMTVEHVIATISLTHPKRNLLTIFIVSPSGTTSQVLTHRPLDTSKAGFKSWKFMSVHFWGERPQGTWTVAIKDSSGKKGYLEKIKLTVYGS